MTASRVKILMVDDRPENLLALEAILGALDQTLVRAESGEEALKRLLTDEFALILLDVQMPGMDGLETALHIKRRERTRDVPIIFLTAISTDPHHVFRGYEAGAVDYIAKPFDPWVLRAKVAVFVELFQKTRQLREQAALLRASAGAVPAASPVPDEVAARLLDAEEQAGELLARLQAGADPALADAADELVRRLREVRAALGALPADH